MLLMLFLPAEKPVNLSNMKRAVTCIGQLQYGQELVHAKAKARSKAPLAPKQRFTLSRNANAYYRKGRTQQESGRRILVVAGN
jgi:hypothetical protein